MRNHRLVERRGMRALLRLFAFSAVLIGVHAASAAGTFNFSGARATVTPGSPLRVAFGVSGPADVEVAVVRVTADEVLAIRRGTVAASLSEELRSTRRPIAVVRRHLDGTAPGQRTIEAGTFPVGFYALRLRSSESQIALQVVDVTALGLVTSDTGTGYAVMAVDLRTMHARSDVGIRRYRAAADAAPDENGVDRSGLATFAGRPTYANPDVLVARASDGSVEIASAVTAGESESTDAVSVQTDRPIYRPGQTVAYRAILRSGMPAAYVVPSGMREVRIRDHEGKVIATEQRNLDAYGTLSGSVALPESASLGTYGITIGPDGSRVAATFEVQAYKKPEYLVDVKVPPTTVGGDTVAVDIATRYFFGRPVAGAKLHYRAGFSYVAPWWRRGSPFRFVGFAPPQAPPPAEVQGDLVASAQGQATIRIPTPRVTFERRLVVDVDARDESGRTITAEATGNITPASFYLTLAPATYFNRLGDTVEVAISAHGYEAKAPPRPDTPVTVTFARRWWDGSQSRTDEDDAPQNVVTDQAGNVKVRWTPKSGGYFELRAQARDERGRDVITTSGVWIASDTYARGYTFQTLQVVQQKSEYAPGERATFLITAPRGDVDALVHVVGGTTDRVFVERLPSQTSTLTIDPPAGVAGYRVSVTAVGPAGIVNAESFVSVRPPPHALSVALRSDRAKYAPGDPARFDVHVTGADGRPARAELSLAVVDDAIYALRPTAAVSAYDQLYGAALPYRSTAGSWSGLDSPTTFPVLYRIGNVQSRSTAGAFVPTATNDVHNATASETAPSLEILRSDFRDTAYWTPAVVTDAAGNASVRFRWPDSLTSYTASSVAVTQQTEVGSGNAKSLVTKDFLVRLAAPRFLRRGDRARIAAIAQGKPPAKSARFRFSAPELGIPDASSTAALDATASGTSIWNVLGGALGPAAMRLAGTSGALGDGLRTEISVESAGTPQHERAAGSLPASASWTLPLAPGAEPGDVRIDLAPSALAQLLAEVRLLHVYPYYCVEQTMSAALPAVYVDRMRKRLRLPAPDGPAPRDVAKRAVDRLVQLQHPDGSWGWWEHDAANPFMSAYALYGLSELAREGFPVPAATLDRGIASVAAQAKQSGNTLALWGGPQADSEWNTRAFMLFALSDARPPAVDRELLAKTDERAKALNSYALAVLGLAHAQIGDRAGAQPLLAELLARVSDDGTMAQWKGAGWHYRWQDDPIETTAYALRFVHALTPNDPRVIHAVNWLRSQQHGSWYATTKDTAAAIYAMSETIPVGNEELDPHETIRIRLGSTVVKTLRIDAPVVSRAEASFTIPARLARGGASLSFERVGKGSLYWSADWTQYVNRPAPQELDPNFTVVRTYATQRGNAWQIGDQVDVDLVVTPHADAQFVAIEDPLPAGLEYQPRQYQSGDDWSGLQFFDDRVVFFAASVRARQPVHLRYTLRATTAGTFTAPAPVAYAMYGPPVRAVGSAATIVVRT